MAACDSARVAKPVELYQLSKFFPQGGEIDERLKLHYAILYQGGQPKVTDSKWCAFPEPESLLTPLHLCSIVGNTAMAQQLLQNASPSELLGKQDVRQWTPLHHAALRDDPSMLELLVGACKADAARIKSITNKNGGTYEDLRRLAFPPPLRLDRSVFSYKSSDKIVEGTALQFYKLTGAQFAPQMDASPLFFIEEWAEPAVDGFEQRWSKTLAQAYTDYQTNPPLLYLDKVAGGYGVFARKTIEAGRIIVDYLGEANHSPDFGLYVMPLCDGKEVRNLGPMINDGFPNCVDVSMTHMGGLPALHVFVALRTLKVGEQVLFSYGPHPAKVGKYINFAQKESERFFKDRSLDNRLCEYQKIKESGWENALKSRAQSSYLHYLLTTPSYQILLMLKEIISVDEFYTLPQNPYFKSPYYQRDFDRAKTNWDLASKLLKLFEDQESRKSLVKTVEYLFSEFPVSDVAKFLISLTLDTGGENCLKRCVLSKDKRPLGPLLKQMKEAGILDASKPY